jgi:hypothetical protein
MVAQAISPNVTADQIATPALAASIPACDAGVGLILFVWPVDFNSQKGDHHELGCGRCVDSSAHKKAIGPQCVW